MANNSNHYAESAMLIRRPVSKVYEAFIDPEITSKFWFTKSSGKLEEGKSADWNWEMFNHTVSIKALSMIQNEKIVLQWGDDPDATIEWIFKSMGDEKTFVTITNRGFKGTTDELISQIRDSTGSFEQSSVENGL